MDSNMVMKKIFFWTTGQKFDSEDVDRIYDEMKYNYYLPSDLANGLAQDDYGAFTNKTLDEAKSFSKEMVEKLNRDNSFCYFIEKEISLQQEEWDSIIDNAGKINLTKLGTEHFPEFEEPTYSILKKIEKENVSYQENCIHIKGEDEIDTPVLDLVTSDNSQRFRLLNNLYKFANKTGLFDEKYTQDLYELNRLIRAENEIKTSKVQTLDRLGKTLQGAIPLKILCYMISDSILIFGKRKEFSEQEINEFEREKKQMIGSVKDYAMKNEIDIEDIFDKEGKLRSRFETIDNPDFNIKKENKQTEKEEL